MSAGSSSAFAARGLAPYLFLAPAALFALVFLVGPLGFALWVSTTDWNGIGAARPVGWGNYRYLFEQDPFFMRSLLNTFLFAAGSLIVGVPLALGIAVLIARSRLQSMWRMLFWLPMITNIVAIAYIWRFLLNDTNGLLNRALDLLGLPGPDWLTGINWAMPSLIMVSAWMTLGHNVLLFLAGLNEIDHSYHEAAELDGAGPLRLFWHVTLPLLRPTLLFVTVTSLITALSSFALMLVMTEGGPARATTVAGLYLYDMAFTDLRLGRASAAAFVLAAIILAFSLAQFRLLRRGGVERH
ncbi:carbohydrate ABC transporter permease [Sphingomonas jatrophae]|uniref:Multiple sugar transport system permease protein n=1 Tax=Sphingomonas jatrophae TaxID=1166337 RepID=A0A1I6MA98_9SPHN|nr:sugar ABC transporter permease [Sphingomonas jatrophae]SFS12472.1 multiple sugar transport system permease protein [Sphingomonas jatrophae]